MVNEKNGRVTVSYIRLTYQRQQIAAGSTHKQSSRPSSSLWWGWQFHATSKTRTIQCHYHPLSAVCRLAALTERSALRASQSTFCHSHVSCICELYALNECVSADILVYAYQSTRKSKSYGREVMNCTFVRFTVGWFCILLCMSYMSLKTSLPSLRHFIATLLIAFDNRYHLLLTLIKIRSVSSHL